MNTHEYNAKILESYWEGWNDALKRLEMHIVSTKLKKIMEKEGIEI